MSVPDIATRCAAAMAALAVACLAIVRTSAQTQPMQDPHPSGRVVAPAGADEVAFCDKCHTTGCPMPHPEHTGVGWPIQARLTLANGGVTCSSCHTPGFRHRSDAFLARDQKGLCSPCHYGAHVLPNAHPFGTPCESCHVTPRAKLTASSPGSAAMAANINGECLRCHYDGPITHPVGVKNDKINAPDLPFGQDGTITCVTCHYGHSNQNVHGNLLRKDNRRGGLCLSCHTDL